MALPKVETPRYSVILPSTGKEIQFRPFLVKEEKVLLMAAESQDQKQYITAMMDVVNECTFKALNINRLPTFDVEYLFVQIRAKSIGESVTLEGTCSECGHKQEVKLNLETVTIDKVSEDLEDTFEVGSGIKIKVRPMRFIDSTSVAEINITELIGKMIDTIYDDENIYNASEYTRSDLDDFVNQLPRSVLTDIEKYIKGLPKLITTVEFVCEKCGHQNKYVLEGFQDFFV
jgi:DNA-directed RNA polymerase subunit M/transcription elongation factor TFIIS